VRVVPRDPGLVELGTVLFNLTFGLDNAREWEENEDNLTLLAALCAALQLPPNLFGQHAFHTPMMQMLGFASSQERSVIAIVRALLPLPDVLLMQDVCYFDSQRSAAVHRVLTRFAAGHDLKGIADVAGHERAKPKFAPRTVVWSAPLETLDACGVTRRVEINDQHELHIQDVVISHPAAPAAPTTVRPAAPPSPPGIGAVVGTATGPPAPHGQPLTPKGGSAPASPEPQMNGSPTSAARPSLRRKSGSKASVPHMNGSTPTHLPSFAKAGSQAHLPSFSRPRSQAQLPTSFAQQGSQAHLPSFSRPGSSAHLPSFRTSVGSSSPRSPPVEPSRPLPSLASAQRQRAHFPPEQ